MKRLSILFLLFLTVSCSSTKETASNSGELDGDWYPIRQEMKGQELPLDSFENQKMAIIGNSFLFMAESADEGNVTYSNGKMDIYVDVGVNAGRHFKSIYKYENEQLTICYDLKGGDYPETFDTSKNPNLFMSTFRRQQ
jgi:uncharacterized protein (TIGR03067 family)